MDYYTYKGRTEIIDKIVGLKYRNILEIGCGRGETLAMIKQSKPDVSITGIEPYDVTPVISDIRMVTLQDYCASSEAQFGCFDLILIADVIEHIWDYKEFLSLVDKLLAPGGYLVVSVPNLKFMPAITKILLYDDFPETPGGVFDQDHKRWFTKKKIQRVIKALNYKIVDISGINSVYQTQPTKLRKLIVAVLSPMLLLFAHSYYYQQWLIISQKSKDAQ